MYRKRDDGCLVAILGLVLALAVCFGVACFESWLFMLVWNKVLIGLLGLDIPQISYWLAVLMFWVLTLIFKPKVSVNKG